jgi:Spy/CpxP family protein refolding chaperone
MTTKFFVGSLLCVVLAVPVALRAADSKSEKSADAKPAAAAPTDSSTADATTDSKLDNAKIKGRLPSGWGKLGVTDAQKQSIYKIQMTYDGQMDALKKQLSDLEAKRLADMRNILTDAQQKKLDDKSDSKATKKTAVADAKDDAPAAAASASAKTSKKSAKHGDSATDSTAQVGFARKIMSSHNIQKSSDVAVAID